MILFGLQVDRSEWEERRGEERNREREREKMSAGTHHPIAEFRDADHFWGPGQVVNGSHEIIRPKPRRWVDGHFVIFFNHVAPLLISSSLPAESTAISLSPVVSRPPSNHPTTHPPTHLFFFGGVSLSNHPPTHPPTSSSSSVALGDPPTHPPTHPPLPSLLFVYWQLGTPSNHPPTHFSFLFLVVLSSSPIGNWVTGGPDPPRVQ